MRKTIERLRTRILRGGIPALLLSASVPAQAAWRGPLASAAPADEETADRAPTWAPATLVGEVLVKSDRSGRLAVVVDEALGARTSRGAATRLFLLTPMAPVEEPVDVRLRLASVVFQGDALLVSTPSGRFTVDIALHSASDGRREVRSDGIVLHDGLALQSLRLAGAPVPIEAVAIDESPRAIADDPGSASAAQDSCQAGGDGASTCTKKCSLGGGTLSFVDECSVTCTTGYHACCNCIVPRQGATCTCVKDAFVGPKQPGVVRLDR